MKTLRFPKNFLWGAACASYQVEGGIENCDWALAAKEGKVPRCGQACDHYHRYESDFDLARNLGHNSHRLSIEWARIEPKEGEFDQKEAEHYRNVIKALRTRGLEPFVTIWHFTLPDWFAADGGFENPKSVERFKNYASFVTKEILSEVKFIQTINEPMVWIGDSYLRGNWPPFKGGDYIAAFRVLKNLIKAHKAAYREIKSQRNDAWVSIAKNNMAFFVRGINPLNYLKSAAIDFIWNKYFLIKTRNELDFIGLNFYKSIFFGYPASFTESLPKNDMGWDIYPQGLNKTITELRVYKKPIYITENGLADSTDSKRSDFIKNHLEEVHKAIDDGVDVRGYFFWSLLDNYEWAEGFEGRFGLVEVDFLTLERKIRPSAYVYKNIAETNSLEI